ALLGPIEGVILSGEVGRFVQPPVAGRARCRPVGGGKDHLMQTRILLVDDHRVLCQGIRLLLQREADMTVVAEAHDGRTAVELARCVKVSVKTAETHRRAIMEKLSLYSVAELTKYAIREGLTTVER